MGNLLDKKEASSPIKEPKLASEKSEIPPDTKTPQITKESIETPIIKTENEKEENEQNNENIIEKEKEQKEEDIPEENEMNQEHEEENIEEENQEEMHQQIDSQSPRDKLEEEPEQYVKGNEAEEENRDSKEEIIELKTPPKGKVYKFMQEGQWYQVDDKGQLYKIVQEGENQQIIQIKQNSEEHKDTPEIQKIVLKTNNNDMNYQMESQRSKTRSSNRFKRKEPKDSNPKVHILSARKRDYENNNININSITQNNLYKQNLRKEMINSEFVEIPRDEYENVDNNYTMVFGQGMDTGEYKFVGEKSVIKENLIPNEKIIISQEEIIEELNRRKKNRKSKEKKIRYEVIDKFYALTDVNGKTIKKVFKNDINKKTGSIKSNYFYSTLTSNNVQNNTQINSINNMNINTTFGNNINSMNIPIQYSNMNMMNYINSIQSTQSLPLDNYSRYFLEQINKLRTEPQSFIGVIEDAKANITKDRYGRLIYNSKLKVALNLGEKAFDEAINFLKNINSMQPLIYNQMITVNVPLNENEILDKDDLGRKVEYMIKCGFNIKSYWRDVIKDPEISFLLMIIDDNGIKSGMRRKDILSPSTKYIGINSNEINNNFVCYVTLGY